MDDRMRDEERKLTEKHDEFLSRLSASFSSPEHGREKASMVLREIETAWFWCGRRDGLDAIKVAATKMST